MCVLCTMQNCGKENGTLFWSLAHMEDCKGLQFEILNKQLNLFIWTTRKVLEYISSLLQI